jgi:hypothetical protein
MMEATRTPPAQTWRRLRHLRSTALANIASDASLPLNYIFTPKNACSSIKASLLGGVPRLSSSSNDWQAEFGRWHLDFETRFCRRKINCRKPFLCISRNPFDRTISAFFDKIGPGRGFSIWRQFCDRYGLSYEASLSFTQFLELLASDPSPGTLDLHFRPQSLVNYARFIRPSFLGRVERMGDVEKLFRQFGIGFISYSPHALKAPFKRQDIDRQQAELIRRIYADDFRVYGYSTDHLSSHVPETIEQAQRLSPGLRVLRALSAR